MSDGETWQEYLAAHLGEPLRNFGTEGHGVYQAIRRMRREEAGPASARYLVLNVYDGDHTRSLMAWRWAHMGKGHRDVHRAGSRGFHNQPWCYVRIDPDSGRLVEHENAFPTPESLYQLCDPDYVYEHFKDDLGIQMLLARVRGRVDRLEDLRRLAGTLEVQADWSTPNAIARSAGRLFDRCALRASMQIIRLAREFAVANGKELMVLLSYRYTVFPGLLTSPTRWDQSFIDFLQENNIRFVDGLQKHREDFRRYRITPDEYMRLYYNGHYVPAGNHFFAFAVKDEFVNWLDPKPPAYRDREPRVRDFAGD